MTLLLGNILQEAQLHLDEDEPEAGHQLRVPSLVPRQKHRFPPQVRSARKAPRSEQALGAPNCLVPQLVTAGKGSAGEEVRRYGW